MKNRIKVIVALVSFLPAFVFSDEPATGWKQTAEGTYYYTNTANWVGGVVNGVFGSDLTLTGAQTIIFDDDIALTNGLNISYAGNYPMTFQSDGTGAKTLMLEKDIYEAMSGNASAVFTLGGKDDAALILDLGGESRVFTASATAGKMGESAIFSIPAAIRNGQLVIDGNKRIKLSGDNTYENGTVVLGTVYLYVDSETALGSGDVIVNGNASFCTTSSAINLANNNKFYFNATDVFGRAANNCGLNLGQGDVVITNSVKFWAEGEGAFTISGRIVDKDGILAPEKIEKWGSRTLVTYSDFVASGNVISIQNGVWNFYGTVSGGDFSVVGHDLNSSHLHLKTSNTFNGQVTVGNGKVYVYADEIGVVPEESKVLILAGANFVGSAKVKICDLLSNGQIVKTSFGSLCIGGNEDLGESMLDLTEYPELKLGAASKDYTLKGTIKWPHGDIKIGGTANTLTLATENVFSGAKNVEIVGKVALAAPNDISGSVTVRYGSTLSLTGEGTLLNAKVVVNRGTFALKSSSSQDILRVKDVELNLGTLVFSGTKNKFVTNRIEKLVVTGIDEVNGIVGGTTQIEWGTDGHNVLKIGELIRTTPCFIHLNKDATLGGDRRIIIDKGVENVGQGVISTDTCPVVPFIRREAKFVCNDPEFGLKILADSEYMKYIEIATPAEIPEGKNIWLSPGKTLTIPENGAIMNSIRTSYGDSSKIEGGQIVLSTGAICLDGNAKPYLNAPIDAEDNRIYIMERAGKGQAVNSKLSGTDGLTVASWSQSSSTGSGGTGVSIGSAESDYTGDTYIYSRIDTPVDFLPHGVERPGNLYLYGYWQCGNYNINMNALFGTGAMRLSNSFTITTTLGHDGSDGNFEGRFIRENGTWSITKIGAGRQRFGGECGHNGTTTIEQGTLQFDGSVTKSNITVKEGACLAGVGSIALDAKLENNTVLYPGSAYLADDKTLDFASKLTFGESATLRLKVYSKSSVSSVDVAGAFSAAGDVTVELDKDTFRGEACILKSSEPLQANFVRGLNCGHLQLRNNDTELWLLGNTSFMILVR